MFRSIVAIIRFLSFDSLKIILYNSRATRIEELSRMIKTWWWPLPAETCNFWSKNITPIRDIQLCYWLHTHLLVHIHTTGTTHFKTWVCTLTCKHKVLLPEPSVSNRFLYSILQRWCNWTRRWLYTDVLAGLPTTCMTVCCFQFPYSESRHSLYLSFWVSHLRNMIIMEPVSCIGKRETRLIFWFGKLTRENHVTVWSHTEEWNKNGLWNVCTGLGWTRKGNGNNVQIYGNKYKGFVKTE